MTSSSIGDGLGRRIRTAVLWPLLLPIHAYRRLISPFIAPRCRYYPTCSTYAVEALKVYGPLRGTVLAAWRLVRCNPWSEGGFDPVEDQRLFPARRSGHDCAEHHKIPGEAA